MRRVYAVAVFVGVSLVVGFITLFLSNADNLNTQQITPLQENQHRMDQVLADDLSMTTSLFLSQLEFQLKRWAEADTSDAALQEKFEQEIWEHQHFHSFAIMENGELTKMVGDISTENVATLKPFHGTTTFSDPYTSNGQQYILMAHNLSSTKQVIGEVDLSFVKKFIHDLANVADANGNFFVSGKHPDVTFEQANRKPPGAAAQNVPEVGWNIVVDSRHDEHNQALEYHEGEAVVKFQNVADAQEWIQANEDIELIKNGDPYYVVRSQTKTTRELLRLLRNDEHVELAEPNYIITKQHTVGQQVPNDEFFEPYQWNLSQISSEKGWHMEEGTEDVIIAILDTGVDPNHQDLQEKLLTGFNAFDGSSNSFDEHGHGTHVAGIASAVTNNVTGIAGVSWHSHILPVKVLDASGQGTSYEVARGIRWATDNDADVINMSLGDYYSSFVLEDAIRYAHKNDVVLIAASGNDNVDTPMYPAAYPEVLTVAAVDDKRERAFFSNFGDYVDVTAPGEHIPSTFPDNNYVIMSGTSMAAPHVAGLAGLIRSINPDLTNDQVLDIIRSSSVDLGPEGRDPYYGFGEINVAKALEQVNQPETQLNNTSKRKIFRWR